MTGATARFAAPQGRLLLIVTVICGLVLGGVAVLLYAMIPQPVGMRLLISSCPLLLYGACWIFGIKGYALEGRTLKIQRPLWETKVALDGLREVRHDPRALSGSLRLFGNGGVFSFSGFFWNRKLGVYRAWVTDPGRAVILRLPKRAIVVSPADPKEFESALAARRGP